MNAPTVTEHAPSMQNILGFGLEKVHGMAGVNAQLSQTPNLFAGAQPPTIANGSDQQALQSPAVANAFAETLTMKESLTKVDVLVDEANTKAELGEEITTLAAALDAPTDKATAEVPVDVKRMLEAMAATSDIFSVEQHRKEVRDQMIVQLGVNEQQFAAMESVSKRATEMDSLTGSEAVFGFAAWLTSRDKPTLLSAHVDCDEATQLVKRFCETNGLAQPRTHWHMHLIHPSEEEKIPTNGSIYDLVDGKTATTNNNKGK